MQVAGESTRTDRYLNSRRRRRRGPRQARQGQLRIGRTLHPRESRQNDLRYRGHAPLDGFGRPLLVQLRKQSTGRKFYIVDPAKKSRNAGVRPGQAGGIADHRDRTPVRFAAPADHHHPLREERGLDPVRSQCAARCRDPRREEATCAARRPPMARAISSRTMPKTRATSRSNRADAAADEFRRRLRAALRSSSPSSTNWPRANSRCSTKRPSASRRGPRFRRTIRRWSSRAITTCT